MKRILAIIIGLSLALPSQAGLYDYYKQLGQNLPSVAERATLAAECGINNYVGSYQQNVELLDCLELGGGQLGSAPFRPSDIDIKIRQQLVAGAARTGTTLNLDPIIDPTSGHRWTMADIGDIAFATLEPGTTNKEIISWTGMTDNTTYYTLTGVQWGYDATGLTTSTANYKRHNSGARFIITDDDHYLRYQYVNQYDGLMHSSYVPSTDQQVATVGFVENRNGYYEAPVANFAALPTGVNQGEMRVTLDDGKVYTWSGSVWILAGAGGGAGTVYRDDITVTSSAQMTYSLSSGSWPDKKYLQVFRNGSLLAEGASADYTAPTTGATITLLSAPVAGEVITLRVESIDFYNANWGNVNTNLTPDLDATHNIGSSTKRFKDLYLSGNATIGGNINATGTIISTGAITGNGETLSSGTTTNKLVRLDGSAKLPAVDGSQLTNLNLANSNYAITLVDILQTTGGSGGTSNSSLTKVGEILFNEMTSTIRVKFSLQSDGSSHGAEGVIYKNGSQYGTYRSTTSNSPVQFSEDLSFSTGDLIQLYVKSQSGYSMISSGFGLYYIKTIKPTANTVNL